MKKWTEERLRATAILRGGKYLGGFAGAIIKCRWQCSKDHEFLSRPNDVDRGGWCRQCYIESRNIFPKICSKCGLVETLEDRFQKKNSVCRQCWNARHRTHSAKYLAKHRDELNARQRLRRTQPEIKAKERQYQVEHRVKTNARAIQRRKEDLDFRLAGNLRSRLRQALRNGSKKGSAVQDLGCTVSQFRGYLESKFQPGMTWENWGLGEDRWQIDHIKPLCDFDLQNREQLLQACHYTNLQPLWRRDNLAKRIFHAH